MNILTELIPISDYPFLPNISRKVKYRGFRHIHDTSNDTGHDTEPQEMVIEVKVFHFNKTTGEALTKPNIDLITTIKGNDSNMVNIEGKRVTEFIEEVQYYPELQFWIAGLSNLPAGSSLFSIVEQQVNSWDSNGFFNNIY